jgi:hypothetical protein
MESIKSAWSLIYLPLLVSDRVQYFNAILGRRERVVSANFNLTHVI